MEAQPVPVRKPFPFAGDRMTRIPQSQLERLADDVSKDDRLAAYISSAVVMAAILDLRDARARIAELERLSASQEEALQAMERGKL